MTDIPMCVLLRCLFDLALANCGGSILIASLYLIRWTLPDLGILPMGIISPCHTNGLQPNQKYQKCASQKFSIQHESLEFESKILRIENSHQHPCEILMPGFYKPNLNRKTGHNFARGKVIKVMLMWCHLKKQRALLLFAFKCSVLVSCLLAS